MPLAKGEPIDPGRLAAKGSSGGLASQIPPGMRVVPVHVDELTGLSRFIFPGMHVDVISTGSSQAQGVVSRTILQNIEVFSAGQSALAAKEQAAQPVFNLLVTPQQAEVLSQAIAQSRIQLVLRNPLDKSNIISEAFTPPAPAPRTPRVLPPAPKVEPVKQAVVVAPPVPPAPPPTIEVIHGNKRVVSPVAPGPESH